jgi:hypothetical protein
MGNESTSIVLEQPPRLGGYALVRILDLSVVHTEKPKLIIFVDKKKFSANEDD